MHRSPQFRPTGSTRSPGSSINCARTRSSSNDNDHFLRDLLAEHLARQVNVHPDALVFTSLQGQPLRNSNFRRQVWYKAVAGAGLPDGLRIHDLRHARNERLSSPPASTAVHRHPGRMAPNLAPSRSIKPARHPLS